MSKNYFIDSLKELNANPIDKEMEFTFSVKVPANTPIGETQSSVVLHAPARPLAALGLQCCIDVIAKSVEDTCKRMGLSKEAADNIYGYTAGELLEYVYLNLERRGELHGLKLGSLMVSKCNTGDIMEMIKEAVEEVEEENKKALH